MWIISSKVCKFDLQENYYLLFIEAEQSISK